MNTPAARQTYDHVRSTFMQPDTGDQYQARWEHTLRVADIGRRIARAEGLDEEALYIACLLHDIGYLRCKTEQDFEHHGSLSADMARAFLESIRYQPDMIDAICYGIEIHTEREEDYRRPATAFELSVGDADNIDRFDIYRLCLNLIYEKLEQKSPEDVIPLCTRRIGLYTRYKSTPVGTSSARRMWDECLDAQIAFYTRLLHQMEVTEQGLKH